MAFILRVTDGRCLYLKDENKYGDQRITVEELTSEDDTRFWWTEDSDKGVLRSVFNPYGCITYQDVRCRVSSPGSDSSSSSSSSSSDDDNAVFEDRCSLVLKPCEEIYDMSKANWRIDTRSNTISLANTDLVMDVTSDYGRVCVWEYHGGDHQLFSTKTTSPTLFELKTESGMFLYNCYDGVVRLSEEAQGDATTWFTGSNDVLRCVQDSDKVLSVASGYLTMEQAATCDMYQGWVLNDGCVESKLKPESGLKSKNNKIHVCPLDDEEVMSFTVSHL